MTNRVDQTQKQIDQAIQTRAREIQKKDNQAFQQKMLTQNQQGASAKQDELSKQVLEYYAQAEKSAEAPNKALEKGNWKSTEPDAPKSAKQENNKKTEETKNKDQDKKADRKQEKTVLDLAVQRRKKHEDEQGANGGGSGSQKGDFFDHAISLGIAAQQIEQTASHTVPIPEQTLNQIVDQVFVGVNPSGDTQFVIDLKENVLGGAQIQVSAHGKNIHLKFVGLDANSRRSLQGSSENLKMRFARKGLQLNALEI